MKHSLVPPMIMIILSMMMMTEMMMTEMMMTVMAETTEMIIKVMGG